MALEAFLISGAMVGGSALLAYIGSAVAQNVAKYFVFYDEFETQSVKSSDLKAGDHIFIPGSISQGLKMKGLEGYYHHGVYLGVIDGNHMVTDFGAVNKTRPVIRKLDDFLGNYSNQLYRRNYKVSSKLLKPEKSLEYAKLICNGKHPWPAYSLNTNNCEHYASLIKMSQVYSEQAQHLPQDAFYRQIVAPKLGESILKQHTQ